MSKPQDIMNQIITQLQDSSALSYVDDSCIFKGKRNNIASFPSIVVIPMGAVEESYAYPKERITYRFYIVGIIRTFDKDSNITGDGSNIKGVMDIENDIKLAIDSDRTLGGYAIHADIKGSENGDIEDYPIDSTIIMVDVLFEQVMNTRT